MLILFFQKWYCPPKNCFQTKQRQCENYKKKKKLIFWFDTFFYFFTRCLIEKIFILPVILKLAIFGHTWSNLVISKLWMSYDFFPKTQFRNETPCIHCLFLIGKNELAFLEWELFLVCQSRNLRFAIEYWYIIFELKFLDMGQCTCFKNSWNTTCDILIGEWDWD